MSQNHRAHGDGYPIADLYWRCQVQKHLPAHMARFSDMQVREALVRIVYREAPEYSNPLSDLCPFRVQDASSRFARRQLQQRKYPLHTQGGLDRRNPAPSDGDDARL